MRGSPSAADLTLIRELAERDVVVSRYQLERWRARGLLPRPVVVRDRFGGSRVPVHPEGTLELVEFLATNSARSRPWQYLAIDMFEVGLDMSTSAVRAAAVYLIEKQIRPFRKAWASAEAATPAGDDPDEELADIGERTASLLPRAVQREVRAEIDLAHPSAGAHQRRELADRALTWRAVDLHVPARMTEQQQHLARHGTEEPMSVLSDLGVLPLPSERIVVAKTLTWAEAEVFRELVWLIGREDPRVHERLAFDQMLWLVTARRRNEQPDQLDLPLPQDDLLNLARDVAEGNAELDEQSR